MRQKLWACRGGPGLWSGLTVLPQIGRPRPSPGDSVVDTSLLIRTAFTMEATQEADSIRERKERKKLQNRLNQRARSGSWHASRQSINQLLIADGGNRISPEGGQDGQENRPSLRGGPLAAALQQRRGHGEEAAAARRPQGQAGR